ncbi:acyltransferase [Shewanella frigidimarina]|uniref:acyltransferase n=1 Tax=Shewanella frigidimarina TaxID=56812 RepID=UPI003FA06B5F|tara:strand:- start:2580 stop:3122 length:543 start_codon:yes stop_codon:yes gene_type:complete
MKKIKLQMVYFLLATINIGSRLVVFFAIRKLWLNIFNIKIGKESAIHSSVKFYHIGNFKLGNNSTINHGCIIDNRKRILIGDNVNISQGTKIYTLGHDIDSETFIAIGNPVIIEDYVCIFSHSIICPGVTLKKGAVVMPGSVVVKDVGAYEVVGGNPAKFIRKRNDNLSYKIDYRYWFAL